MANIINENRKKQAITSSFDGKIEEIPYIFVDNFKSHVKSAYFLSHYHVDHTVGLRNIKIKEMRKTGALIYASPETTAIIKEFDSRLSNFVRSLEPGRTNSILITLKKGREKGTKKELNVTTIPAHHCFGSVMFLFQIDEKNILYTGDFRIDQGEVANINLLHDAKKKPIRIDKMYVDTTFQNVTSFPKRSVVAEQIAQLVQTWLTSDSDICVEILTSAYFGYEEVCKAIHSLTKKRTFVDDSEYRRTKGISVHKIYNQFPEVVGITNRRVESRIYLKKHDGLLKIPRISENTKRIILDARSWQSSRNLKVNFQTTNGNETKFCFSTHCGKDELVDFIKHFNIGKISGFPDDLNEDLRKLIQERRNS